MTYYAFDLLYADGYDLRGVSLELRKQELRKILSLSERVRFSDHQVEKGVELFEVAKQQRLSRESSPSGATACMPAGDRRNG